MGSERVKGEMWCKRQALNVVAQLPDEPAQALAVLKQAERLVEVFLKDSRPKLRVVRPEGEQALGEGEASLQGLA